MTKHREQGHYNAADRFVWIADVCTNEVDRQNQQGTQTFDRIWRSAHPRSNYLVLRSGFAWLVTSMTAAKMNDQGIIEMGPYKLFTTEDAAIMYASIMASQGKEIMSLYDRGKARLRFLGYLR